MTTPRVDVEPTADATKPREHRRELVVAPLPIINPTLDNGAALVVGMLYTIGSGARASPPSATFAMGMGTSNDTWAIGLGQTLRFGADRYRMLAVGGYANVNFRYFGIGTDAGDDGQSVLLNQTGYAGVADFVVRVGGRWYAGARYRLMHMSVSADLSERPITVPPADARLRTGLLGPHVQWDSRNSEFYPTTGVLFDAMALFAGSGVGGRRNYQTYQLALSRYAGIGQRHVIAAKVNSCLAEGDAPFYDLCLLGQYQDIRGYPTGQYRDRSMLTAQAEYRVNVWWRVGLVAFGGAGEVAPGFDRLTADGLLPSAGAGLRFRLTRETPLNLRVDYAWGRGSQALYVSVGEAF
jgi:outer membrane protein assembly factor BamA